MPDKEERQTRRKARSDMRKGKAASTAAGEFVREEIHHVREGKHGARSTRQAIAIGLSKARRAGVPLKPPKRGQTSAETREDAERALKAGRRKRRTGSTITSKRRARAARRRLKREPHRTVSKAALSRQARRSAARRGAPARRAAARKAAATRRRTAKG